jgi:hypothetical protein
MCDYSLMQVLSRPAKIGEKLMTRNFGTGTRGFCSPDDPKIAVCVLPGTELAFERPIDANVPTPAHCTAIFRQINKDMPYTHHDALELPNGQIVLLTRLTEGQLALVLQLPIEPKTTEEAEQQKKVAFAD